LRKNPPLPKINPSCSRLPLTARTAEGPAGHLLENLSKTKEVSPKGLICEIFPLQ
jgi:hypothetical protein